MQNQSYLQKIIDAVKIISDDRFLFAGKNFSANLNTPITHGTSEKHPLVTTLSDVLYQQCYCRVFEGHFYHAKTLIDDSDLFKSTLSTSNYTQEKWEKNWIIEQVMPAGSYIAKRNGHFRFLFPGEFFTGEYQNSAPREGAIVTVLCPRESFTLQPGFYFVFSNQANFDQHLTTLVRLYWNVKHTGAARLIELVTKNLNKYSIPFTFKCLNNQSSYQRSDSAVLYVNKPYYHITMQVLEQVYPQIQHELNEDVPGFTKALRPGLGLAEDPATGESFGMSRCLMIAQGMYNASLEGLATMEQIESAIKKVFGERGSKLEVPYLNFGSTDIYNFFESSKN